MNSTNKLRIHTKSLTNFSPSSLLLTDLGFIPQTSISSHFLILLIPMEFLNFCIHPPKKSLPIMLIR
ncbi:hypothetical protein IC582_003982 [Cucumis melo]